MDFLKELQVSVEVSKKYIERKEEIQVLQNYYEDLTLHVLTVFGKRQVGKTVLLQQFIKDKPAIYYQVSGKNSEQIFDTLLKSVKQFVETYIPDKLYITEYITIYSAKEKFKGTIYQQWKEEWSL